MNEVVHTSPTIGSNVEEIVVKNIHFLMWDIGGQESLRSSWNMYYTNTEMTHVLQTDQKVRAAASLLVNRECHGSPTSILPARSAVSPTL
ncbi:ADP-ribosylation factor-like protein 5B isoform X1 [Camelus dromedarius]|uniref:ADP-ribosylation factor-like protein 5B isoform X1 n=1 Tax=Camelus dromedarius TaxID=9838 RepID=UPI0031192C4A